MIKRLWFWRKNAYELGYLNWYVQFWQKLCITKILSYRAIQGLSILKIKHLTLTRSWMNGQFGPMNFSAERKKTRCVFFYRNFRDLGKKKKHGFWIKMNEWMTNLSAEIKKYGTFAFTASISCVYQYKIASIKIRVTHLTLRVFRQILKLKSASKKKPMLNYISQFQESLSNFSNF